MRLSLAILLCGLLSLVGCGGSSGASGSAPLASAGGPYTGVAGMEVSFNGTGSISEVPSDPNLTYTWSFGDGQTGTGGEAEHTYAVAGSYTATLTVANTYGLTASATAKVTIGYGSPTANPGGPYSGMIGIAVSFDGTASTDYQGQALTYSWNFGDNSPVATGATPTHIYNAAGIYTVSLTVTNTSNLSNSVPTSAVIVDQPPVANAGGPYTGTTGIAVTFNGSKSSDPQGEALTYAWNFGDGSTGTGVSPTHTYTGSGAYTVSLVVTNVDGVSSVASAQATATIALASAGAALTGVVSSGSTPIVGAHVYLFAANTTGYGAASLPMLVQVSNEDSIGPYVLTGSNGGFSLTGNYACTSGQQLYLYATGGNTGSGTNANSGLLAAIGNCTNSGSPAIFATVNELSTVAAAYAMSGFATDATHVSSSGTALALTGVANAFANAANLASLSTGTALATTPAGNGTVPQTEINTLANILAGCVNTASSCGTLLSTATADGTATGTKPTDTATAAINIAHHPGANIAALYALASSAVFSPKLSAVPNDFTVAINFTGGGLNGPSGIAIDGSGNAWLANAGGNTITQLSTLGAIVSGTTGYTGGGLHLPNAIAIDGSGNAWVINQLTSSISKFSGSGSPVTGSPYTSGGLNHPIAIAIDGTGDAWIANNAGNNVIQLSSAGVPAPGSPYAGGGLNAPNGIAIDGTNNVWIANNTGNSVTKLSNTGTVLSGTTGYTGSGLNSPSGIALDSSGNAWVANLNDNTVSEFSTTGAVLSGTLGYTGGALNTPNGIAIDGSGSVWVGNETVNAVTELSKSGVVLSGANGYESGNLIGPRNIAIDGSGNVWISNFGGNSVTELIGAGTPVVTPLATGVKNNTLGTRP